MLLRAIFFSTIVATAATLAGADTALPTTPSELREALSYENYDKASVVAIVVASELPDYSKEGMLVGLERFEDNPDALKAVLQQIRAALELE